MKKINFAIVGATGAVGRKVLEILNEQKDFLPIEDIKLLASDKSAGTKLYFNSKELTVERADSESFNDVDIAIFCAGSDVSIKLAPEAVKKGTIVIDNSSAFRMQKEVPLIIPEVNPDEIKKHKGIIANPNCSTIQMVVALKPIYDLAGIKRIIASTFQSVSGTGIEAVEELKNQSAQIISGQEVECKVYPYQIAFNVLPHIDEFDEMGNTKEELKLINETKKILNDWDINITATAVRVPVIIGHSESVYIETVEKTTVAEVREALSKAPGVIIYDKPSQKQYPLPIDVAGKNEVFVGRIREDISVENGLNLWIVADNLRKGAAYNALQISKYIVENNLV
ncbi:MAG TPA: aspartate-semialdehyde dehydrogenase [Thermoanaerobacterales bacterium]|nr:aspartate-semialdehyde dehydrogenase [Thermoanaerobacterales bacterium]